MNDEYREDTSGSEQSSRTAGASTATAEPVDRRWFEEALRAQGFLVEPPTVHDDTLWQDTVNGQPLALEGAQDDQLAIAEAEAIIEADEPFAAEMEGVDELAMAEAEALPEPWDLPIQVPSVLAADAGAELQTDSAVAPPSGAVEPTSGPIKPWPVIGTSPARQPVAPVVEATGQPVVPSLRQAVPPATLSSDVPPVPTAALAARLARPGTPATATTRAPMAPAAPSATAAAAWPIEPSAPTVEDASTTPTSAASDVWTLPASQADLAVQRDGGAAPTLDAASQPALVAPSQAVTAAEGADSVSSRAATAASIIAAPAEPGAPPDPITASAGAAEATTAPSQPATSFSPPTASIAAIARRPASPTVGTTVDGGDSDLWRLVGDPAKTSAAAAAAPAASSSSTTTVLLTIFVAIVVVALVLGFIYLFTSLL